MQSTSFHRARGLQRVPAAFKLAGAVGWVFLITLMPRSAWVFYGASAGVLAVLAFFSGTTPGGLGKKLLGAGLFVLGTALLALPQAGGFLIASNIVVKSGLCLFVMILLGETTRFSEILQVLRRLRMPALLLTTLALAHRYIFVLRDELQRLSRARRSRTFVKGRRAAWHSAGTVVALLFVRASERAERIYDAMCARGWKT
jgi:cobalt/nickel transport system permease protein